MTYLLTIDQAKIDAPNFPRGHAWWKRFLPGWITIVGVTPEAVTVSVTTRNQASAAHRWLYGCGGGRLRTAVQRTGVAA